MSVIQKKEYTMEDYESTYNEIHALYDLAEELVNTIESEFVTDPATQLDIVEPLINELGDAADILTSEFLVIAENKKGRAPNKNSKAQVEGALRKVFAALNDYQKRVCDISKKAHGAIMNIADPIVAKIQRQIEKVVVIFFEFIQISLQSIMNKVELETLKARDARVALLMHQFAIAQHQN